MKKSLMAILAVLIMTAFTLAGCGSGSSTESADPGIPNGTYVATFTTDNPMFHVNDANNDKGILTVENGQMTIHVSLQSKKIINLYYGLAEDAQKDGAELIEPTTDEVTYSDGYVDEVYGFDIPVPALDEEFDVALIGTHGNWYDHKVVVSNPVEGDDIHAGTAIDLEDGDYQVDVAKEGGTGKADIDSPAAMTVKDGKATLTVKWSSPHYDYMIVDGEKYEPVNKDELASAGDDSDIGSVFEIPISILNEPFSVIADTTAMSEPHEIEYKLTCTLVE
ncbi:MAG: iron transporter [Bacillota bacterium]